MKLTIPEEQLAIESDEPIHSTRIKSQIAFLHPALGVIYCNPCKLKTFCSVIVLNPVHPCS